MKDRTPRKTLGIKTTVEFYNEVVNYAHEHYMSITTLIKRALYETYGLDENNIKNDEDAAGRKEELLW